jgi:heme exporter protein CcmD
MPNLDKYGPYVLACYGVAVILIVGVALWTVLRLSAAKRKLDALEAEAGQETRT